MVWKSLKFLILFGFIYSRAYDEIMVSSGKYGGELC